MAQETRATRALRGAGVAFTVHAYAYDPAADSIGLAAAAALGVEPGRVFKTLMVLADGKPACVLAPSDGEVALKRVAAALGAKSAAMMPPAEAERISGYKIGGISPFGQTRRLPAVIDASAAGWDAIFLNGGQRGLQVRLAPAAAQALLAARTAPVSTRA
ncbi:YbaK/EbsC family protein [Novosphingobium piscinae]|uniref:Cys-tRNA(Pro)/Cys-tRNA(Cys) deacylase n=1 Tax=Novosphingobium piscinae TaxID=1507448 RepID=A0A7X1KNP6_9SPHN|nr:YbaK/EbsC family protein [Novosphingobium piscinae]MBC2667916.1 Cys-tRNA(Pro) deacylase [Novosphingobium piscinae]